MAFDSKSALNHAIKYLTDAAHKRAAGGWIPPKEEERRKKEAAKAQEKHQKLLSKQFPTHYMPNVGRQVMQTGGTPDDNPETLANQPYDLGQQLQRGAQILGGTAQAQYERYGAPIVTGIQELMRPVYEGGTQESYQNPEMVGRAMDVVGGLGAGSLLTGPSAAQTNVLRSGMGPVAREVVAQPQRSLSPLGFYSAAAERASALQPSGDAAQMIAALKNTQGLKTEELMNAGLIDAAGNVHPEWAGRGKVMREDLVSHLQGQMPQVEETVLGGPRKSYEKVAALEGKVQDAIGEGHLRNLINGKLNISDFTSDLHPLLNEYMNAYNETIPKKTKYEQYTLPGGENYREVLLKLPEQQKKLTEYPVIRPDGLVDGRYDSIQSAARRAMEINGSVGDPINTDTITGFRSPHWSDLNVLAHIRMADRTGPNGEKILHVEELQSDWGQKGKKEGFKDIAEREYQSAMREHALASRNVGDTFDKLISSGISDNEAYNHPDFLRAIQNEKDAGKRVGDLNLQMKTGLPSAPYVTSTEGWTDLALKRVLKEAAEGGYDKVVWTPGAEQAKRYDLSKQISKLTLEDGPRGEQMLRAYGPSGDQVISRHITDAEKEIPDLVGKDVAQKLLSQDPVKPKVFRTDLSPSDIKVTPLENRYKIESKEGWSSHVGNRVVGSADEAAEYAVKYFNQLAKEANDKVAIQGPYRALEGQDLSVGGEGMKGYYDSIVPKRLQNIAKKYDKEAKLGYTETHHRGQVSNAPMSYTLPSLDITPAMREAILRGQSAYQRGGAVQGYDNGGSIGIGGMAAFGDPSKGPDEYGVTTPMEAPGDLLMNMSPEQREYLVSEMVKQVRANPESTANSPLAAGIESYDVDAAQARDDARRAEQQALRDVAVQRAAGTTIAEKTPQATGMFAPPAETTAFGSGIRDVGFPSAEMTPITKAPVSLTSDTREAPKTIRQSFNQAFADAKAAGLKKFTWVNPATGKAMVYTTQIARKEGGRVPSLANPDDWIDADEKPKAKKIMAAKKPAKSDGTAIVNRALMLSSKKS